MAYERNNFKTGQVLTADALNHMEDGIAMAMEGGGVTVTTYAELKALRDAGQLKAGAFYRITDYMTTTTQENTQSAGHPFDVIVLALDGSRLSEKAWAAHHEGDEYFKNSNLSAWQIWYCLDNDESRFAWADTENGKGVIYRMIDEWGNDVPYDFKNILYVFMPSFRIHSFYGIAYYADYSVTSETEVIDGITYHKCIQTNKASGPFNPPYELWIDSAIPNEDMSIFTISDETPAKQSYTILNVSTSNYITYTFSSNSGVQDASLNGDASGNDMGRYYKSSIQQLNKITFVTSRELLNCHSNSFGSNCYNNSFGDGCHSNSFGSNCYNNSFGDGCYNNSFGSHCFNNSFGGNCYYTRFGSHCYDNSFGGNCYSNSFGSHCFSNSFGDDCYTNSFGEGCFSNSFGSHCYNNSLGCGCGSINFESEVHSVIIMNGVYGAQDINTSSVMLGFNSEGVVVQKNLFDE